MEAVNEREIILDTLMEADKGTYLSIVLGQVLIKYGYLSEKSRSFIKAVCEGTMERRIAIDYIISLKSSVKINKMKPLIRTLLRMSVYQLKYMDGIPESAAINEAVKLAKKRKFQNLSGFVNGVLRNINRMELSEYPSKDIEYSVPEWMYDKVTEWYGEKSADIIFKNALEKPALYIRSNKRVCSTDELLKNLTDEGISAKKTEMYGNALEVYSGALFGTDSFYQGAFQVQDISSMISCLSAAGGFDKDAGVKVLDICAAPGGKSLMISELLPNAVITARDLSETKAFKIEENIERLGAENIIVEVQDATVFDETSENSYDLVIADLPCSGLGVIGRKGDIKYRLLEEDLKSLKELQRDILKCAARYLKKDGVLLYSTCTINPGENVEQLSYIEEQLSLKAESIEEFLPEALQGRSGKEGYIQLLPGIDKCDGFFISRFRKK